MTVAELTLNDVVKKYTQKKRLKVALPTSKRQMLPIEHRTALALHQKVQLAELYEKYPVISLEFLRMRRKDGWPRFGCYNPWCSHTFFSSTAHLWNVEQLQSTFPIVNEYFEDVFIRLSLMAIKNVAYSSNRGCTVTLLSYFDGILPDSTVELLKDRSPFTNLIIVKEVESWHLEEEVIEYPKNPDPLLIGVKKTDFGTVAFLLDKFDVTVAEDFVAKEFLE